MNLQLKEFKSWLLLKNKNEVIGKTFNCYHCPIANYIKEITKEEIVVVGDKKIYLISDNFELPDWAKLFIEETDKDCNQNKNITVEEALSVLNNYE